MLVHAHGSPGAARRKPQTSRARRSLADRQTDAPEQTDGRTGRRNALVLLVPLPRAAQFLGNSQYQTGFGLMIRYPPSTYYRAMHARQSGLIAGPTSAGHATPGMPRGGLSSRGSGGARWSQSGGKFSNNKRTGGILCHPSPQPHQNPARRASLDGKVTPTSHRCSNAHTREGKKKRAG